MTGLPPTASSLGVADLVVVGAGIVGLGCALHAARTGLRVAVVERDATPQGASVRNFGHGCVTAQAGSVLELARRARTEWVRLGAEAGFWVGRTGTVLAARHDDELAVLKDLSAEREAGEVVLLDAGEVSERVPVAAAIGGAWMPADIRVSPREAVPAIAGHLAAAGVTFHLGTSLLGLDETGVTTSRGTIRAPRVVVAVGHDVDHLFPAIAERAAVTRCALRMLRVANPTARVIEPAVFTGWSLLRYGAFATSPTLPAVRERLAAASPRAMDLGLHLMLTQRPDGDLVIGDTHAYGPSPSPFAAEDVDDLLLDEVAALLGTARPQVKERWQGVYASAPEPFLVADPLPGTRVVSVTAGIGMTTALALTADVVAELTT